MAIVTPNGARGHVHSVWVGRERTNALGTPLPNHQATGCVVKLRNGKTETHYWSKLQIDTQP
jgi:hypothetical protein